MEGKPFARDFEFLGLCGPDATKIETHLQSIHPQIQGKPDVLPLSSTMGGVFRVKGETEASIWVQLTQSHLIWKAWTTVSFPIPAFSLPQRQGLSTVLAWDFLKLSPSLLKLYARYYFQFYVHTTFHLPSQGRSTGNSALPYNSIETSECSVCLSCPILYIWLANASLLESIEHFFDKVIRRRQLDRI